MVGGAFLPHIHYTSNPGYNDECRILPCWAKPVNYIATRSHYWFFCLCHFILYFYQIYASELVDKWLFQIIVKNKISGSLKKAINQQYPTNSNKPY
jgi:hypothetical protein